MAEVVARRGHPKPPPPDPELLEIRQRARRDRIVQMAMQLMVDTDYDSLQMKDITAAAGVALGTTYRYFNSKDHLVAEALLRWAEQFRREGEAPPGRGVDRLKLAFRRAARAFELYPCMYGHLLAVQSSTDPYAYAVYRRIAARRADAFGSYVGRVPSPRRERIIGVMSAVLTSALADWSRGRLSMDGVYERIDSAAELLLE